MTPVPALSLVLVAHRSSAVLAAAADSFRREAAALGVAGEVIVVEQSEDAAEVERVRAARPDALLVRPNRGYAAGVNAGAAAARGARLLVGNPDVELFPGALAALLAAQERHDVVGPQFTLAGALFPPADVQTPAAERARRRATHDRARWERHLGGELAAWRRVWEARDAVRVPALSGALLLLPAALLARVGPWDERYFLYFEETDWLRRATRAGATLAIAPAALVAHRWGHAARPAAQAARFAASRRRFYRRHFPLRGRLALRVRERAVARRPLEETTAESGGRWLASPSPHGFPAALLPAPGPPQAAAEALARTIELEQLTLVSFDDGGALRGPFVYEAAARRGASASTSSAASESSAPAVRPAGR